MIVKDSERQVKTMKSSLGMTVEQLRSALELSQHELACTKKSLDQAQESNRRKDAELNNLSTKLSKMTIQLKLAQGELKRAGVETKTQVVASTPSSPASSPPPHARIGRARPPAA